MHRLTARLLLFFALAGNLAPLTPAATAPPHACCVRKAAHHCHDSLLSEGGQFAIRDVSCNHDCCRGVTTPQWAYAQPTATISVARNVEAHLGRLSPASPNTEGLRFQSTRAPPHLSIG